MRNLSADGLAAMMANETAEEFIVLLTLDDPAWSVPIRRALRRTSIISRSNTFFPAHFEPTFPSQDPDELPRWRVMIDGIDQTVLPNLRAVTTEPTILAEVVRKADPDTVEMTTGSGYTVKSYSYKGTTIIVEVSMEDFYSEGFPGPRYLPSNYPGAF